MRRPLSTVQAGVSLLLLLLSMCMALGAQSAPLSETDRKRDPRLEKPVTLLHPRAYYLGELLEILSAQTGVVIRAGDRDKADSERIFLRIDHVPLADVMNALWSLVSYRGAAWRWEVIPEKVADGGSVDVITYRIIRPRAAQLLGAKLRQQVQDDFEAEAAARLANLDKATQELSDQYASGGDTPEYVGKKRSLAEREAFAEMLPSAEDRAAVLQGREERSFPVSELGPKAREYIKAEIALKRELNPRLNVTEPTQIKVARRQMGGTIAPCLMIYLGNGHAFEGYSCIGGTAMENKWLQSVADQWLLPGDKTEDPAREKRVLEKTATASQQNNSSMSPLASEAVPERPSDTLQKASLRLWQCAEGTSISFIACVPGKEVNDNDRGSPQNIPLWAGLKRLAPMQAKWRSGILLVRDPTWVASETEESRVPWAAVKELRDSEVSATDGLLPLSALAHAADNLLLEQLQKLSAEFRVFRQVGLYRDWFARMSRKPDLIERLQLPQGVPVREMPIPATAKLPSDVSAEKVAAVAMRVKDDPPQGEQPALRHISFNLIGAEGKPLGSFDFFYTRPEYWTKFSGGLQNSGLESGLK